MGLRNWLFGDDGCDNHHFGELELDMGKVDQLYEGVMGQTEDGEDHYEKVYFFNPTYSATCQHEGCDEEKTKTKTYQEFAFPKDELCKGSGEVAEYNKEHS